MLSSSSFDKLKNTRPRKCWHVESRVPLTLHRCCIRLGPRPLSRPSPLIRSGPRGWNVRLCRSPATPASSCVRRWSFSYIPPRVHVCAPSLSRPHPMYMCSFIAKEWIALLVYTHVCWRVIWRPKILVVLVNLITPWDCYSRPGSAHFSEGSLPSSTPHAPVSPLLFRALSFTP